MLFSIITICLNPGPLLDETIRSLAVQREAQWEHLIIDGGSSDGTVERLEKAAADDDRVRWISEPDSGIADAMNKGLAMARGEIIAFLHADDRYAHENVLADVAACFSAHGSEAGWATGGMREIDLREEMAALDRSISLAEDRKQLGRLGELMGLKKLLLGNLAKAGVKLKGTTDDS